MAFGIVNLSVRFDFFNVIKYTRYYRKKYFLRGKNVSFSPDFDFKNSSFGNDVYIGRNVILRNSSIDNNSYVSDNSKIINTKIGKFCSIGPNVKIILGKHPIDFVSTHPSFYSKNKPFKVYADKDFVMEYETVVLGNDVWIGDNVIIPNGIKIGNGAVIAAGAIVTKDVEPYSIVGGIPAKIIKYRFDKSTINKIEESNWWNWTETDFFKNYKSFQDIELFFKLLDSKNKIKRFIK